MKVGVFYPGNNNEHLNVLTAFATGIKRQGYEVEMIPLEKYKPVDMAVVFGVKKKNMPISYARGHVIDEQNKHKLPVIVLEKGYVNRHAYYAAGYGGLNGHAYFVNEGSPSDRWKALKTPLQNYKMNPNGHYLVCGQVPTDASVQHIDINQWTAEKCKYLQNNYDNKVVFRPHPLAQDRTLIIPGVTNSTGALANDLEGCKAVITFNSNAGVEALIAGIPVYAEDRMSMVYNVAMNQINMVKAPIISNRTQWSYDLAYAQWTVKEMSHGMPWLHLIRKLNANKEKR